MAANIGVCDFKDVVAFGNNQLLRPLAGNVKGHHSGLPQKMVRLIFQDVGRINAGSVLQLLLM